MAIIIAHWEMPAAIREKAAKKLFARWPHTAKAFGVTELVFVEIDELPPYNDAEVSIKTAKTLDEALKMTKGKPVYVEVGGKPLKSFKFPKNPVFVFGSDFMSLPKADVSMDSEISLHSEISLGIVLNQWHSQ